MKYPGSESPGGPDRAPHMEIPRSELKPATTAIDAGEKDAINNQSYQKGLRIEGKINLLK